MLLLLFSVVRYNFNIYSIVIYIVVIKNANAITYTCIISHFGSSIHC